MQQLVTQLSAFTIVTNKFCRLPVLFIEQTPNPVYLQRWGFNPLFSVHSRIEYRSTQPLFNRAGLRLLGKISSCFTLGLYLRPSEMLSLDHQYKFSSIRVQHVLKQKFSLKKIGAGLFFCSVPSFLLSGGSSAFSQCTEKIFSHKTRDGRLRNWVRSAVITSLQQD